MVRFMGNGLRISNVAKALCSDCSMRIYHIPSRVSYSCNGIQGLIDFMLGHGYKDIFYLELEQRGEI